MGDGRKLKKILDERHMTIKRLSDISNIAPTTLYTIIKRDSHIRLDFALTIAGVLKIPVNSICSDAQHAMQLSTAFQGYLDDIDNANPNTFGGSEDAPAPPVPSPMGTILFLQK